jgi:hypothetical protein
MIFTTVHRHPEASGAEMTFSAISHLRQESSARSAPWLHHVDDLIL